MDGPQHLRIMVLGSATMSLHDAVVAGSQLGRVAAAARIPRQLPNPQEEHQFVMGHGRVVRVPGLVCTLLDLVL